MYEFFPGNYRWSFNALYAFTADGQFGDVALILSRLQEAVGDDEVWHREWAWLGDVLERRAEAGGTPETQSANLFYAALYRILAEHFVPPADPRRMEAYGQVLKAFEQARALSPFRLDRVLVPYEGTTLPAYFQPAAGGTGRRPTLIYVCGLDTTKEMWYLRVRQEMAMRGFNSLFIDTPGIGEALRYQKLYTRPDYEKPVSAAVDYLVARPEVDEGRIGLIGSSLGGYYVARSAAFEPRLRAAVAWGAIFDYHAVWMRRLNSGAAVAAPGFQLMYITGTDTMEAAVASIADFRVVPFGDRITCPFLVMHGAEDQQVPMTDARAMFDAIGSKDKELKIFTGEDGGAAHSQFDNHFPALQFVADWMVKKFA